MSKGAKKKQFYRAISRTSSIYANDREKLDRAGLEKRNTSKRCKGQPIKRTTRSTAHCSMFPGEQEPNVVKPIEIFSIRSIAILATLSIYGVSTTSTILQKSSRISNLQHQDILSSNFRQLIHSRSDLLSLNH